MVLFVQWIFFNTLGWAIGLLFATFAVKETPEPHEIFGLIALFLGIGQWVMLRKFLRRPKFVWIILTIIGFVLGQLAAQALTRFLQPHMDLTNIGAGLVFGGLIGITLGFLLGLSQFMLLPKGYAPTFYWIVANTIGWGLGFQISSLMGDTPFQITSLATTMMNACITGFWLTQLLVDDEN